MMKTKLTVLLTSCTLLLGFSSLSAQVTIGTNEPPKSFSVLEVVSGTSNTGGLRLPQLTDADKTAIETALAADPTNSQGLLIYSITNDQVEYWDGTQWVAAKSGSGGTVTIPDEPWLVSGGSTQATSNSENIYQLGQVTIGNAVSAISSAALNVDATNKGVLFPRIALSGDTDASTIASPATGLLVYNTGTGGLATAGYYYWSGTKWELAKAVEPWLVLDGADAGKPASSNTQNIYQLGTINIGTSTKDNTAILNVNSTNKGVLLPRVALKSSTDAVTIPSPTTGLLVYNTGAEATFPIKSYMFWNGTRWESLGTPQVENGLNVDNQGIIRLGGTLNQDTEIDQDGNTLTIASDEDLLYITGLAEGSQDDSRALVVDVNTGKVGTAPTVPAVLTFVQSESIYSFDSGSNGVGKNQTMSTNSSAFGTNLNTGEKVVVPFTNDDIVTNNKLTSFDPSINAFTLLQSGSVEISGYVNYSCGNSGADEVLLNLTIQVRENTGTATNPAYANDWEDYSSVRAVWVDAQPYYRNSLMVPPAIYEGNTGDQIRMVVVRPFEVTGTTATFLGGRHGMNQSYEVSFTIPWGTKFSRGLKIIAQ